MNKRKKVLVTALSAVLLVAVAVGGTLAWLTTKTDSIKNTFTVGNIDITLTESKNLDLKMVPGNTIEKDPKVTVKKDSEASWLFVKIDESQNLKDFIEYSVADGWDKLNGESNIFYRSVGVVDVATGKTFYIIKDNQVKVINTVTKDEMDELNDNTRPTLTFTAYAVQSDNISTAIEAWNEIPAE